jgi:hypothetical protein
MNAYCDSFIAETSKLLLPISASDIQQMALIVNFILRRQQIKLFSNITYNFSILFNCIFGNEGDCDVANIASIPQY